MIVAEVIFLTIFWVWVLTAVVFLRHTALPRRPITASVESLGLPVETVRLQATDGLRLEGWKIPAAGAGQPWILLCHGAGSNRADFLEIAPALHEAGFNLLMVDFRGHGGSEGWTTSFGWREQRDLEGALAFLGQQGDVPARPYGVFGISMGAVVALMVAARDERLAAVVADSPYDDLEAVLGHQLKRAYPLLPRWPVLWGVLATYRLRFGVWPRHVAPEAAVGRIAPRPLLFIHGAADGRTPVEGMQHLADAAGQPKAAWVSKGSGHVGTYGRDPAVYVNRLTTFFRTHLSSELARRADQEDVQL